MLALENDLLPKKESWWLSNAPDLLKLVKIVPTMKFVFTQMRERIATTWILAKQNGPEVSQDLFVKFSGLSEEMKKEAHSCAIY